MSENETYLYSVQIGLIPPGGGAVRLIQITGGDTLKALLDQAANVEEAFVERGWSASTATAPAAGGAASSNAPADRPANILDCTKIEVGESFKDPKRPQLKFHCTGENRPVIANAKPGDWGGLLKFVSGITVNGRAFTAADMVKGKSFGGLWLLEYEISGDYKNLGAIRNG